MPTTDCLSTNSTNNTADQRQQHNGPPHYVDLHVNAGELVSLLVDGQEQLVAGPRTITMISQLQNPPVPIPVQVPPGHMIHQIADENGTLKHIILSIMDGEETPVINLPQGSFRIDPNGELVSTSVPGEINTITTLPQQTNFANYDGCPVAFDATAMPESIEAYGPTLISPIPLGPVTTNGPPPLSQPYCNNYTPNHHSYSNAHHHQQVPPPPPPPPPIPQPSSLQSQQQQQQQQQQQHYHGHQKSLNLQPNQGSILAGNYSTVYPNYETTASPTSKSNHMVQQQQMTTYRIAESDSFTQRNNREQTAGYGSSYGSNRHNESSSNNTKRQLNLNDKQLHNNRYNNVKVISNNHVAMSNMNSSSHRTGNSVSPIRTRLKSHQSNGTRANHYQIKDTNSPLPNHQANFHSIHHMKQTNKSTFSHNHSNATIAHKHPPPPPPPSQQQQQHHQQPHPQQQHHHPQQRQQQQSQSQQKLQQEPITNTSSSPHSGNNWHSTSNKRIPASPDKKPPSSTNLSDPPVETSIPSPIPASTAEQPTSEPNQVEVVEQVEKQQQTSSGQTDKTSELHNEEDLEVRTSRVKQKKCQNQHRNHSSDNQKQHNLHPIERITTRPDSLNDRPPKSVEVSIIKEFKPPSIDKIIPSKTASPARSVSKSTREVNTVKADDLIRKSEDPHHQQLKHKNKHNNNSSHSQAASTSHQSVKSDSAPKVKSKTKANGAKGSKGALPVQKQHHQDQHQKQQQPQPQQQPDNPPTLSGNRGNTSSHNSNNYNSGNMNKTQPVKLSNLFRQCRARFVSMLGKLVRDSLASCNDTKFAGLLLLIFTLFAMLLAIFIHVYIVAPVTE